MERNWGYQVGYPHGQELGILTILWGKREISDSYGKPHSVQENGIIINSIIENYIYTNIIELKINTDLNWRMGLAKRLTRM